MFCITGKESESSEPRPPTNEAGEPLEGFFLVRGEEWACDESGGWITEGPDGDLFCATGKESESGSAEEGSTAPPEADPVEDEPEGPEVAEGWMCLESGYDMYMEMPDGRIICIDDEPEERTGGFPVDEEWHCTEGGGTVERNDDGVLICYPKGG